MENYTALVAEYGFFVKMTVAAFAAITVGFLIRKRPAQSRRQVDS